MGGGELTNTNTVESEIVASQLQMRVAQGKDTLKSLDPPCVPRIRISTQNCPNWPFLSNSFPTGHFSKRPMLSSLKAHKKIEQCASKEATKQGTKQGSKSMDYFVFIKQTHDSISEADKFR